MAAKLSTFLMILIAFMMVLAGGFAPLMAEINNNYDVENYNSNRTESYNKLNEITENTQALKNKSMELQSRSGVLDVLGGFFESAYDTIKISVSSFSLFDTMKNQAIDDSKVANAEIFRVGITAIAIIAIFLGIIVAIVVKRDV